MLTRIQAIDLLLNHPIKFARMLGFSKLKDINEEWLIDMMPGKDKEDDSLQAHRNSYKTTCVSITLARIIILLPMKTTAFMRKTDTDVKEIIRQVQKILSDPHTQYLVECIYGEKIVFTVSNSTEINTNLSRNVKGTSQLVGLGIGSSLTGKHFDYIFTDDISNVNDRISKAERERTKLVYQELQNIKNRGGRIYNTLTPWHVDDVSSIMPPAKKYTCYETDIMTEEDIEEKKKSMLPSLFAANYELRHIASEDVIFTLPHKGADRKECYNGLVHLDSAYGGEDFTALTVICKKNGKYYVLGKMWRKHVEQCYDDIIEIYNETMPRYLFSEDNGDKGFVARDLKRKGLRTHSYHESTNKFIKITSILKVEWDKIEFVDGTDEAYIQQILDYNENAEHDDAPDSLACAVRKLYKK